MIIHVKVRISLRYALKDMHEMLGNIVGGDALIAPPSTKLSEYGLITKKYIENINEVYDDVFVDRYVIMPNHIHMIIIVKNGESRKGHGAMRGNGECCESMRASTPTAAIIPGIIRSLKILVTKECGFSIWQRSYHDRIIRNTEEYHKIRQYIKENPSKWQDDKYYTK